MAEPENIILQHLVALRRKMAAVREWQEPHGWQLALLTEQVAGMHKALIDARSEQLLLDNKLLTRRNELLGAVRRIEAIEASEPV